MGITIGGRVGVVVIGRNEGSRLEASLASVRNLAVPVIYVDSGSKDKSVNIAARHGAVVVELNTDRPFSAARARNEGFMTLKAWHPAIDFVQFLDGDCTLQPRWLGAALAAMDASANRAIVAGALSEFQPDGSIYNRLCSLEWRSPTGDLKTFGSLGGIMMVRASVFAQLGGFDAAVVAGEDAEFGVRVALAGLTVTKIDAPMATHDADMQRFGQWWQRAVRGGHAIGQRAHLNGGTVLRDCVRERRSTWFWGVGLPLAILSTAILSKGASLVLLMAYAWLGLRIYRNRRAVGESTSDALLYARFTVIGKFANAVGLLKFCARQVAGRVQIIEYK